MSKPALIFVNAPPRAGKDTVAAALAESLGCVPVKFAEPIRRAIAGFFDVDMSEINEIVENHKGRSHPLLFDAEIRDLMIGLSEGWAKPRMGDRCFGRLLARKLDLIVYSGRSMVVSDAGFETEVDPVVEEIGPPRTHMLLIRLFRGPLEDEKWDSRKRLDAARWPGMASIDLHNDGTIQELKENAVRQVVAWYTVAEPWHHEHA